MQLKDKDIRHSLSLRVSWLSIAVNLVLAIIQFVIGFLSNSISILTDAVDSLRDIIATGVVVLSLYISKKPADKSHPFGHGRAEDVGGLTISFLLIIIGFSFLKESLTRLFHPKPIKVDLFIITVMLCFSGVKLLLGLITSGVSRKVSSEILRADAIHHYTDFVTTLIVGVGLLFVRRGGNFVHIDSFLGLVISLIIVFFAIKMSKEFIDNLIGKRAPTSLYDRIGKIAANFKFVEGVHDIEIHSYGENRVISLHIELSPSLSLEEAHGVADGIENEIFKEKLGKCVVHVDLKKGTAPMEKKQIEKLIRSIMGFNKKIKDFHGIEIITTESSNILNFHLLLDKNTSLDESHSISHRLRSVLEKKFYFSQVNIHFEPYKSEGG
jgi:cation diffusion facilitator family transporter